MKEEARIKKCPAMKCWSLEITVDRDDRRPRMLVPMKLCCLITLMKKEARKKRMLRDELLEITVER